MKVSLQAAIFSLLMSAMIYPVLADQTTEPKTFSSLEDFDGNQTVLTPAEGPAAAETGTQALPLSGSEKPPLVSGPHGLTPMDQGTSRADLEITAAIRKVLMARKEVSLTAKNVKIITQDGKVTLRGAVKSFEEKNFIYETACGLVNEANVYDQLEIAGNLRPY